MKSCAVAFLLASTASAAVLKESSLARVNAQSNALRTQSQALDYAIQAAADNLKPGPTYEFLRALRLCAPCKTYERFGEDNDGGYVMCTDGLDKGLVGAYSYGVNGYDGWGMGIAHRYRLPLHEYDCTNAQHPAVCHGCNVVFHGECILENDGKAKPQFKTLTQQLAESGNAHAKDGSLLLKIDVEAAEWKVFAQEPIANLKKFREIVVEYHWINQESNHALYAAAVKKMQDAGFAVAHLHGNNFGGELVRFGEYSIPNVLEVTYTQKPATGCAANIPYLLPQDMPNNPRNIIDTDKKMQATLPKNL